MRMPLGHGRRIFLLKNFAETIWTRQNFDNPSKHLRVKLMEMMRATLRAVDYTAKACRSCRAEIALHAARERDKLGCLPASIRAIYHRLRKGNELDDETLETVEAIRAISVALFFACKHAHDASLHIASLAGEGRYMRSQAHASLSECINRSLRLCIVAFASREISHAESALRNLSDCQFLWTRGERMRIVMRAEFGESTREQLIEQSLVQMMESVRTVALLLTCPTFYSA